MSVLGYQSFDNPIAKLAAGAFLLVSSAATMPIMVPIFSPGEIPAMRAEKKYADDLPDGTLKIHYH
jgi:hypothetical protein